MSEKVFFYDNSIFKDWGNSDQKMYPWTDENTKVVPNIVWGSP